MFANIESTERKMRIIIGLALIVAGFTAPFPEQWHLAAMTIGVPVFLTAALGFCPLKALVLRKLS